MLLRLCHIHTHIHMHTHTNTHTHTGDDNIREVDEGVLEQQSSGSIVFSETQKVSGHAERHGKGRGGRRVLRAKCACECT